MANFNLMENEEYLVIENNIFRDCYTTGGSGGSLFLQDILTKIEVKNNTFENSKSMN